MRKYRRLSPRDRYQIEILKSKGATQAEIAKELGRCRSTIFRELKLGGRNYTAESAVERSKQNIKERSESNRKIRGRLKAKVDLYIKKDFSPEQIEEVLKEHKLSLSLRTIYRYIERDKLVGGKLKSHLRILRRQRKDRKKSSYGVIGSLVKDKIPISKRPKVVEKRQRIGDYERDTVLGVRGGRVLLTIVDRKTRYVHIACLERNGAELVHKATVAALRKRSVKTITNDNGTEFAFHQRTAKALKTSIYFSRAYRAWERGTNENLNGLLRQYFPKQKPIPNLTKRELRQIERHINRRPRKCLGFKTPHDLYKQKPVPVLR